jgi:hypothetical protein
MNKLRQNFSNDFMPFYFLFLPNDDTHFVVIKCDVNRNVYSNRLREYKNEKKNNKKTKGMSQKNVVAP